jgi:hypothetical protein
MKLVISFVIKNKLSEHRCHDVVDLTANTLFPKTSLCDTKTDPKQETSPNAKSINYQTETGLITLDREMSFVKYHQRS